MRARQRTRAARVCAREYAVRGRRWIDRKAAEEAVSDRAITSQPRALQGSAQCDFRQRATQNCHRQDSEIYFESATASDRSAVRAPPLAIGFSSFFLKSQSVISSQLSVFREANVKCLDTTPDFLPDTLFRLIWATRPLDTTPISEYDLDF